MNFNISYATSVNNAPAAFRTAVTSAFQYFQGQFNDPITININVGYGQVNGQSLGGALGASLTYLNSYSYSQVKNALAVDSKSSDDATSIATLPAADPIGG